jgi:hypothetical protein
MIDSVLISDGNRNSILSYIRQKKQEGPFRVIDVGGSMKGWSVDVVDAICDMNDPDKPTNIQLFKMNINLPDDWKQVDTYVQEHGKFDFSICSHTLEDISNPKYVCQKLSQISKAGYIAVPSKYIELARFEHSYYKYRGFIHHRWIFSIDNNTFVGYPKIPYLEHDQLFDSIARYTLKDGDLSFKWNDSIDVSIINGDYLGPDIPSVITYYKKLFKDDLDAL